MRRSFYLFVFALILLHHPAWAGSNDLVFPPPANYTDDLFHNFSKQAGLAISYIPMGTAEPLGITGFDVGGEITLASIDSNQAFWTEVTRNNTPPNYLPLAKIHADKGLPLGIDVGVVYSQVPNSNISLIGGDIKWAFLRGNLVMPALAVRASYTDLLGVSHLGMSTFGVDLSISKGFGFITPYAGIGEVWIQSRPENAPGLSAQQINLTKGFVGVKIALFIVNFVGEADFSSIPLYSARLNVGF